MQPLLDALGTRFARFFVNGLIATAAHYLALVASIEQFDIQPAGLANFLAAIVGISVSFIGNRLLVFRQDTSPVVAQGLRFLALYALMAVMHGLFMTLWTDLAGLNYRIGFLLITATFTLVSYFGNQRFVFR